MGNFTYTTDIQAWVRTLPETLDICASYNATTFERLKLQSCAIRQTIAKGILYPSMPV